jgi:predicted DNA-binding transcriptional regulator AlpA
MSRKWLRFDDLKERGLVNSRPALARKIEKQNFPPGVLLGPNTRAWAIEDIEAWEAARPVRGPGVFRGAAKRAMSDPEWIRTRRSRPHKASPDLEEADANSLRHENAGPS